MNIIRILKNHEVGSNCSRRKKLTSTNVVHRRTWLYRRSVSNKPPNEGQIETAKIVRLFYFEKSDRFETITVLNFNLDLDFNFF